MPRNTTSVLTFTFLVHGPKVDACERNQLATRLCQAIELDLKVDVIDQHSTTRTRHTHSK